VTGDGRETDTLGRMVTASYLDPEGVDVRAIDPANTQGEPIPPDTLPRAGAYAAYLPKWLGGSGRCRLEGMDVGCGFIASLKATGMVGPASGSNIRAIYDKSKHAYVGFARWDAQAARDGIAFLGKGSTGFLPLGVSYLPDTGFFGSDVYQWFVEKPIYGQPDIIDISYYEEIYGYQQPQSTITAPIGDLKDNLLRVLSQRTALGTCEEYTTQLLAQAAKMFAGNYPHINTIMDGYQKITGPNGGGYILKQFLYDTVNGDLYANGARPGTVWLVPNRQIWIINECDQDCRVSG